MRGQANEPVLIDPSHSWRSGASRVSVCSKALRRANEGPERRQQLHSLRNHSGGGRGVFAALRRRHHHGGPLAPLARAGTHLLQMGQVCTRVEMTCSR